MSSIARKSTDAQIRANKNYYNKNREDICEKQKVIYQRDKEKIKARRRLRYAEKKKKKLEELLIDECDKALPTKLINPTLS